MLMKSTAIRPLVTAFRTRAGETSRSAPSAPISPPIQVMASRARPDGRPRERNSSSGGEILTRTPRTSMVDAISTKTPRTAPAISPTSRPSRTRCGARSDCAAAARGGDAAQDRCGERFDAWQESHEPVDLVEHEGVEDPRRAGEQPADREGRYDDPIDVDAHQGSHVLVLADGAHRSSGAGALDEIDQGD